MAKMVRIQDDIYKEIEKTAQTGFLGNKVSTAFMTNALLGYALNHRDEAFGPKLVQEVFPGAESLEDEK